MGKGCQGFRRSSRVETAVLPASCALVRSEIKVYLAQDQQACQGEGSGACDG